MAEYYPPVGFHFEVTFRDLEKKDIDVQFQSVSGLNVQFDTETFKEGGENRFEHRLPTRTKYPDLVLKRGVVPPGGSAVTDWCIDAFEKYVFRPIDLQVTLLNQNHQPLMYWEVVHAWPKSWKYNELNAEKSEVFLETLELNINRFRVKPG